MFSSEKQLVDLVKLEIAKGRMLSSGTGCLQILEEVNLGFGIADLVVTKYNSCRTKFNSLNELNYFDLSVYKIIEGRQALSFQEIEAVTRTSKTRIQKALEKLIQSSYIMEEDKVFHIKSGYYNSIYETVAIEAKLKNWRRALEQAYRYKWFSSLSYVVLDKKSSKSAIKNISSFQTKNIGLILIDTASNIEVPYEPFPEDPIDKCMHWLLNEQMHKSLII